MGWTSYYTSNSSKEECLRIVNCYKGTVKKTVSNGSKFYALMTTPKGEDWVLLLLNHKRKGEFYYKDIQCNPHESGVPLSILKEFVPSNENDKAWLEKQLKVAQEKKATTFKLGDIVKCKADYDLDFGYAMKIKQGEEFWVKIEVLNPYAKRRTFIPRVYVLDTSYLKNEVFLRPTSCRLRNDTFKYLKNRELETELSIR